jgi:hypothetical protein
MILYYSGVRRSGAAIRKILETDPPDLMTTYYDLKDAGKDSETFWTFMAIHRVRAKEEVTDDGKVEGGR